MYATPYSCFFFLSSFCSQVLCCSHKRCNNESRAGKSFLSWVLLPLQYAGAGRRKVTTRREDDRRRAMLFSLDKRERERTPSEALFIQPMHLLAREEDRMLFSACLLLAGCVFLRKEGTKPDKSRISDTTATINYSKSVCLSSNCRKKENPKDYKESKNHSQMYFC
jgi:hypothetical protein